ncbi:MAG: PDR/VanB family oxidoreductase [Mycobacterium sp.]
MENSIIVRIAEIQVETPEIRGLRLETLDGSTFPEWHGGAHVDVTGPTGVLRQYSLAGSPGDDSSIWIAVKREGPGGASAAMHHLKVGDHLKISKPRNMLGIFPDAAKHILIAGGIGLTPLMSMAFELYSWGADFELHYFARSRDEMAFDDFLTERVEYRDFVTLHVGVSRADRPEVFAGMAAGLHAQTHVYTCGPEGFMDQVVAAFTPAVGAERIHLEAFTPKVVDSSNDTAFTVELESGEVFEIPADRSILDVLEEAGCEVYRSCGEGICGSCVSGVLEGVPDHRDNCLSEKVKAGNTEMALCVSRALTDKLVIELY